MEVTNHPADIQCEWIKTSDLSLYHSFVAPFSPARTPYHKTRVHLLNYFTRLKIRKRLRSLLWFDFVLITVQVMECKLHVFRLLKYAETIYGNLRTVLFSCWTYSTSVRCVAVILISVTTDGPSLDSKNEIWDNFPTRFETLGHCAPPPTRPLSSPTLRPGPWLSVLPSDLCFKHTCASCRIL